MSSLIEWPSLYGSSYFIPAVVVVVLLLALLLLMSSRRRASRRGSPQCSGAVRRGGDPTLRTGGRERGGRRDRCVDGRAGRACGRGRAGRETAVPMDGPAAPMASAPTALLVAAEPEPEAEAAPPIPDLAQLSTGRNIRVTAWAQAPVSGIACNDPMNTALLDILGGWGDLSPEDLKRLELFRPERLAAAVAAIQLPQSKSGEAKARLSQLRQYSADLERRSTAAQAAAATQPVVPLVPEEAPVPKTGIAATPVTLTAIALGAARRTTPESSTSLLPSLWRRPDPRQRRWLPTQPPLPTGRVPTRSLPSGRSRVPCGKWTRKYRSKSCRRPSSRRSRSASAVTASRSNAKSCTRLWRPCRRSI